MRDHVQRRLQTMLFNVRRMEREIEGRRPPISDEWQRILWNVRAAGAEIDSAVRYIKENLPT